MTTTPTTTAELTMAVTAALSLPSGSPGIYPTDAGGRVYSPRDWPTWDKIYPAILIGSPREQKASLGRNQPQFTVISTIRLTVRFSAPGKVEDMGAGVVQAELWNLQRQIEVALINAPTIKPLIQQYVSIESQIAYDANGERHLGAMLMDLEMEFYQGPEDFYPIIGAPIADMAVATPLPTTATTPVGADIQIPQD